MPTAASRLWAPSASSGPLASTTPGSFRWSTTPPRWWAGSWVNPTVSREQNRDERRQEQRRRRPAGRDGIGAERSLARGADPAGGARGGRPQGPAAAGARRDRERPAPR